MKLLPLRPSQLHFLALMLVLPAAAQKFPASLPSSPPPQAPDASVRIVVPPVAVPPRPRLDPAQLSRDAQELLQLAEELQPDMDSVNKGLLPKETLDKLRRIEKLSKRLRSELAPK